MVIEVKTTMDMDNEGFAKLARQVPDRELSQKFGCSLETIRRWKSGKQIPHSAVRSKVLTFLIQKIFDQLEE